MYDTTGPVVDEPPPTSLKAAGKRPAMSQTPQPSAPQTTDSAPGTPAPPSTSATRSGAQTRQKRVLPSRSRRGGPGVGSCDVDVMILETRRRRYENEPLVPAQTNLLLTTNGTLVPNASEDDPLGLEVNTSAFGRYFDRPEVQRAYKEQQMIQTPEFVQLTDDAAVGGRFRPRGSEEESADTSDAAYEKRHKKYETFEKRQRLREKEKLKHEHYKLKERIDQLRAMDTSAFLALPASALADKSSAAPPDSLDTGLSDLPGAHVNGAAAYNEGERRRKEMLDIAMSLEERYRVLLPPDRKWSEKKAKDSRHDSAGVSIEPELSTPQPVERTEVEVVKEVKEVKTPATKAPSAPSRYDSDGESEVDFEERERLKSKQLKLRIKFPPRKPAPPVPETPPQPSPKKAATPVRAIPQHSPPKPAHPSPLATFPTISPAQVRNISAKSGIVIRAPDGKFLPKNKRYMQNPNDPMPTSISAPAPPRKRPRKESSASQGQASPSTPTTKAPHASYAGAAGKAERTTCLLMISALRSSSAPNARKTQRHVTAFGTRVPPEIEEVRDFEIPGWLRDDEPMEEDEFPGFNGNGFYRGSSGVSNGGPEEVRIPEGGFLWEEYIDTKDDLPPIATLDDD